MYVYVYNKSFQFRDVYTLYITYFYLQKLSVLYHTVSIAQLKSKKKGSVLSASFIHTDHFTVGWSDVHYVFGAVDAARYECYDPTTSSQPAYEAADEPGHRTRPVAEDGLHLHVCVCVWCMRACVRACVRVCVVRACVRVCL